jgi:hypothetical protein
MESVAARARACHEARWGKNLGREAVAGIHGVEVGEFVEARDEPLDWDGDGDGCGPDSTGDRV